MFPRRHCTGPVLTVRHSHIVIEGLEIVDGNKLILLESASSVVERNRIEDSAGISIRSSGNVIENNKVTRNVGSGIRLGGDVPTDGINNTVRFNVVTYNAGFGVRVVDTPQRIVCGNHVRVNALGPATLGLNPARGVLITRRRISSGWHSDRFYAGRMALIRDLLAAGPTYSFEFFPPKTDEAKIRLEKTIQELEPLQPTFASVTYGAGGSTRSSTREVVIGIETDTSMTSMAHLTCVGHSRADIVDILNDYEDAGVQNVLALAGDPQRGGPVGEFTFATELVGLIRQTGPFSIGVAAHPEGHPRSADLRADRRKLAEKLDMADFAITQFFFRASDYHHMMGELAGLGCDKPVLPGIMPVTSLSQVKRFAELSGAAFPPEIAARLEAAGTPEDMRKVGIEIATAMCQDLLDAGAPGLHFYTLNQSTATREIYRNLGLAPETAGS